MQPYHGGGEMIKSVRFEKTTFNELPYKFEAGTPDYVGIIALGKALEWVKSLGIENIEVIIVNDQTQDNSMDIINEYASKYPSFKIITNDVNKGLGESRNAGLENVTSDYVAFVDSDDFISDNTLKDSLLKIKESNADLLIYNIKTYTGNEFIEEESVHNQNFSENLLVDNIGNYPKLFFSTSACNKIYHKSLFPLINFSKGLYEDNVVTCNVLLNARNIYLNKDCDYFYRKNRKNHQ